MINPFFKNHGPFQLKNFYRLSDIDTKKFSDIKITDIKDLVLLKKKI